MARYRKLIESSQENEIVCDNPNCDFKIANDLKDPNKDSKQYINVACPECGDNLLTQEDYDQYIIMLKVINWINKWFSWVSVFIKESKGRKVKTHVHNGIKFSDN